MKHNARRLLSFLIAVVMAFGLTACGKEKEDASDPNHMVIGDFELQYKGASIMADSDGKDAVVLTMDFTNNSEETAEYLWSVYGLAMQDGAELEAAVIFVSEKSYETVTKSQLTDIEPGKTIEVRAAYTLKDAKKPVEITFTDLMEKNKGTLTVDPTTLKREETLPETDKTTPDDTQSSAGDASAEPQSSGQESAEPADNDYGKSNPDAKGIAKLEAMQELYKKCYENRTSAHHLFNYEDAVKALGCDGTVRKKASFSWNETKHTYRWVTEDGKDYFNISFALEGDEEWYDSCSFSDNVKNNLW